MDNKKGLRISLLGMIALCMANFAYMADLVIIPIGDTLFAAFPAASSELMNFILSGPQLIMVFSMLLSTVLMKYLRKERLMALMDVENAAIAMIDEDQQEGIKRLFDRLADLYIDLIDRVIKRCPIDSVLIHDDWAHQNGLFFSRETHREMILPYLKRVIDFCHSKGLFYEHHCCGKAEAMVPEMLACGVDLWSGQSLNDQYALAHQYKDEPIIFGITHPKLPENASKEEIREIAREFLEDYRDCKITISMDDDPPYSIFELRNQDFLDAVYEFSRIAYQNEE